MNCAGRVLGEKGAKGLLEQLENLGKVKNVGGDGGDGAEGRRRQGYGVARARSAALARGSIDGLGMSGSIMTASKLRS